MSLACPRCRSSATAHTPATEHSNRWRCEHCGSTWLAPTDVLAERRLTASRRYSPLGGRRFTDRLAADTHFNETPWLDDAEQVRLGRTR